MKTRIFTVIATTVALAASVSANAADRNSGKATVEVNYHEPENFADFKMTERYLESDAKALEKELTKAIERAADRTLPPGYTLNVRFTDIDLAGDVNPFQRINLRDVREYRGVYPPRLVFEYAIVDTAGNTVLSGSERLVDMAYDMRLRMPGSEYTRIEAEMLRDFVHGLGSKIAKGHSNA